MVQTAVVLHLVFLVTSCFPLLTHWPFSQSFYILFEWRKALAFLCRKGIEEFGTDADNLAAFLDHMGKDSLCRDILGSSR